MKCMCKQSKWLIIIATVGLILGCFVLSKMMAAPHGGGGHGGGHSSGHEHHDGRGGRGWGGRGGYWGGGVGVGVGVDPYYDDAYYGYGRPYYNSPVVVEPVGPSVGFGIGVGRSW